MSYNKKRIAIIGAGQAGLQLAFQLLNKNYHVSLFSEKNALQIKNGNILSTQCMFADALQIENELNRNDWEKDCPHNSTVTFSLATATEKKPALTWEGKTKCRFQSVDQRLKYSHWLTIFEKLGGLFFHQSISLSQLNSIADDYDLTIVASGKTELANIFPLNKYHSQFLSPQRVIAGLYLKNSAPENTGVHINLFPEVGEFFCVRGLTFTGPCEMLLFEGIPHKALDCWSEVKTLEQQFALAKIVLAQYFPWEAERFKHSELTDNKAGLIGQLVPIVRHPIAKMASGKMILGLGDAIVLNDPIAGQGANHASKAAYCYGESIIQHGSQSFDQAWMLNTAEKAWQAYGKPTTDLSNLLLNPPAYLLDVLTNAAEHQNLADELSNGFNNPADISWLFDSEQTISHLQSIS